MVTRVLDQPYLDRQLSETLRRKGVFSDDDLAEWRQAGSSHEGLEAMVVGQEKMNEEDWTRLKGDVWGVPYKNLTTSNISAAALEKIPETAARNYSMIAFQFDGNELSIGLVEPYNVGALEALEFLGKEQNWKILYFIISASSFEAAVKQYHPLTEQVESALTQTEEKLATPEEEEIEDAVKKAPIAKIVSVIIQHAVEGKASDIHIEPLGTQSRVRYRIDGVLHTSLLLPKYAHSAVISRIKVMAKLKLDETRLPQDGRTRLKVGDQTVDLRISVLPLSEGEKIVIRVLDVSVGPPKLADLGYRDEHRALIEKSIKKPHGLLLITGPTGSGKSTTLFGALALINEEGANIVTLEDPIEYFIEGINQSQVNPEIGYNFASGLRSILRQDPNVIMVGEVRDRETAELVIHASLTGHFVLSTLHTNDALGAVPRLMDMDVEPFLLASALDLVVAQRLVRKLCPDCRTTEQGKTPILEGIVQELKELPEKITGKLAGAKLYHAVGCSKCGGSGYKGRIAIAEALQVTDRMQEIIAKGFEQKDVLEELKNQAFVTIRQDGLLKALSGQTSLEEVIRATTE